MNPPPNIVVVLRLIMYAFFWLVSTKRLFLLSYSHAGLMFAFYYFWTRNSEYEQWALRFCFFFSIGPYLSHALDYLKIWKQEISIAFSRSVQRENIPCSSLRGLLLSCFRMNFNIIYQNCAFMDRWDTLPGCIIFRSSRNTPATCL